MNAITVGRVRIAAVVERAGPTRPTWLLPDARPERVERYVDGPVLVLGTHFHHPTVGRIVRAGETWRFRVL